MSIDFFYKNTPFVLEKSELVAHWLLGVVEKEKRELDVLNYVFCSDTYLHKLNKKHLGHDTLTDVLAFDFSNTSKILGDIYVSIERVTENACTFGVSFREELARVMVHGLLHLLGYEDNTKQKKKIMHDKENLYIGFSGV